MNGDGSGQHEDRGAPRREALAVPVADGDLFELTRQVGVLYWRREPLNITAMKRRHPELLAAAFALSPFVGWKRLLDIAGIPYGKIRIELQDTVPCAICGARYLGLQVHLHRIHGVSAKTYLAEFPGSEISGERLRARFFVRTAKSHLIMPHWERLWSKEYVLDRIAELHRHGVALNVQSFFERGHEPSRTRPGPISSRPGRLRSPLLGSILTRCASSCLGATGRRRESWCCCRSG